MQSLLNHLSGIGFSPAENPATSESILKLEATVGVSIPHDYRDFMLSTGGGWCIAGAPCTEPTPFGDHVINSFDSIDDVIGTLDSAVTPRNMISIGYGDGGAVTALALCGIDHGSVYSVDSEMRIHWNFNIKERFPDLDPSVARFFELRDSDGLPEKPWGYDNAYHVANSFKDFVLKLKDRH